MKKYATPFAVAGAFITAVLFVLLNLLTTPGTLWSVCPVLALAMWPLGVYLCRRKLFTAFSIATGVLLIAILAAINLLTAPGTLWFPYTAPLILCWPIGMVIKKKMISLPTTLLFGGIISLYCVTVNLLLTPGYFWAVYPIFAALWWPMRLYFTTGRDEYQKFSIAGAALTIVFLITSNLLHTSYPWALYACFPIIWWPIAMYAGKKLGGFRFSIIASLCAIAWYAALNIFLSPGSPWVVFIVFAALWWPLSVYFYGRRCPHIYAMVMTIISIAFFTAVNLIWSPAAVWAFYPAFALLWWPVTLLFSRKKNWLGYSVTASLMTIAFLAAVNLITSPSFLWFVFPSLGMLWWPSAIYFSKRKNPLGFSVAGSLLAIALVVAINMMTSPGFLWFVFPTFAVLWWPLSMLYIGVKAGNARAVNAKAVNAKVGNAGAGSLQSY